MTLSRWLPRLVSAAFFFVSNPMMAADTNCGGTSCSEAICSSPDVIECSDWNNPNPTYPNLDGWGENVNSGHLYRNGGDRGDAIAGVGLNGTGGVEFKLHPQVAETLNLSRTIPATYGPIYARAYIKFSANYHHDMSCGMQKDFYFMAYNGGTLVHRVQLGTEKIAHVGGTYAGWSDTIGVFGFDYIGHVTATGGNSSELPDHPGDVVVPIYPNVWYAVEFMAQRTGDGQNVVKIWVNGTLTMTRTNAMASLWPNYPFNMVWSNEHNGGGTPDCWHNTETEYVWKDNYVISNSYIGPIGATSGGGSGGGSGGTPVAPPAPVLLPN